MKCKDFQNSIVFYLDGDLNNKEAARFEKHIENCSQCELLFAQVSASYNFINEDRITEINPFFYSRIKAAIDSEKQTSSFSLFSSKGLIMQIAAYLIIGFFAISAGYFIANDKNYIEQESIQMPNKVTDEELFADTHYLTLSIDDLYIVKAKEIEE